VATTDKLVFATRTSSVIAGAALSVGRSGPYGIGDPAGGHGYISGGSTATGGGHEVTSSDKVTFATDATASITAVLSSARYIGGTISERSTKGYYAGGQTGTSGTNAPVTTIDKLTFSTDTIASMTISLAKLRQECAGTTDGSTKGYISGGDTDSGGVVATKATEKIVFSGDTISSITGADLSLARFRLCATSNGSTAGYFMGGASFTPPLATLNTADKLTFATDTTAAKTSANLTVAKYLSATAGDGTTYSYIQGGSITAACDGLTYSTETCANVTSAALATARGVLCGTASTGYG
jgi:hypothetical protein